MEAKIVNKMETLGPFKRGNVGVVLGYTGEKWKIKWKRNCKMK